MNKALCFVITIIASCYIGYSYGFADCPGSSLADPGIANVGTCMQWAAYVQSTGGNFTANCLTNPQLALKCCFACRVYQNFTSYCSDSAFIPDCQAKAQNGQCNVVLTTGLTVGFYCPKSCGLCGATTGPSCSYLGNICGPNGVCSATTFFGISTIQCNCNSGYFGSSCTRTNICLSSFTNPCRYGSTCSVSNDEDVIYTCSCANGCSGKNCDSNCNCLAGSIFGCQNNGQCQNNGVCACPSGYSGALCQSFVGGCITTACQNGGTCNAATGQCQCPVTFTGAFCQTFLGCLLGGAFSCQNGGTCQNSGFCICPPGFSGSACQSAIGCIAGGALACVNGNCNPATGLCVCPFGFTGTTCANYLGCAAGGSLACVNGGICNTATGICQCQNGYTGNTCSQFLGCSAGGVFACVNGGNCNSATGLCVCPTGYTGTTCASIVGCVGANTCANGGLCQPLTNGFLCICQPGFSGTRCEIGNACSSLPCLNGATCTIGSNNQAICTCATGYFGQFCASTSACAGNPCQNGGTCSNQPALAVGYYCACPANFYGVNCQVRLTSATCSAGDTSNILCPFWASLGYCDYKYLYNLIPVPIYCPISCKLCNQFTCIDTQTSCPFWANAGLCSLVNSINPNICRKSCGNCPFKK